MEANYDEIIIPLVDSFIETLKTRGYAPPEIGEALETVFHFGCLHGYAEYTVAYHAKRRDVQLSLLPETVKKVIAESCWKDQNGSPYYEIFADYDDELAECEIAQILDSYDPELEFAVLLEDKYSDIRDRAMDELRDAVRNELDEDDELEDQEIWDEISEQIYFDYDDDHFLEQMVNCDLTIDTGDMNFDFTLNSELDDPESAERIIRDGQASIVWLAKQQGYSEDDLIRVFVRGDAATKHKLLASLVEEVGNSSDIAELVFLLNISLRDAIYLRKMEIGSWAWNKSRSAGQQEVPPSGLDRESALMIAQYAMIQKENPVPKDTSVTWIRTVSDISIYDHLADKLTETADDPTPDYTKQMVWDAVQRQEITVYSSKVFAPGIFVTPSRMEAAAYAGDGPVYKKTVALCDVAWIDLMEGQYAPVKDAAVTLSGDVVCGLYDRVYGSGSVLGIEFDQGKNSEIKIPVSIIARFFPDAAQCYPIQKCYDLCRFAWKDCVKKISV